MTSNHNTHIENRIFTSIILIFSCLAFILIGVAGGIYLHSYRILCKDITYPSITKWIIRAYGYDEWNFLGTCSLFSIAMVSSLLFSWVLFSSKSHQIFRRLALCIWAIFASFIAYILACIALPFAYGITELRPITWVTIINNGIAYVLLTGCVFLVIYKLRSKFKLKK